MGKSPFVNTTAIARNAPCPCGSGKRYKDCHGALSANADPPDSGALLQAAQLAFVAGRRNHAQTLLRRPLERGPHGLPPWNLLRECLLSLGSRPAPQAPWGGPAVEP